MNCMQLQGFPIDSHTLVCVRCMIKYTVLEFNVDIHSKILAYMYVSWLCHMNAVASSVDSLPLTSSVGGNLLSWFVSQHLITL